MDTIPVSGSSAYHLPRGVRAPDSFSSGTEATRRIPTRILYPDLTRIEGSDSIYINPRAPRLEPASTRLHLFLSTTERTNSAGPTEFQICSAWRGRWRAAAKGYAGRRFVATGRGAAKIYGKQSSSITRVPLAKDVAMRELAARELKEDNVKITRRILFSLVGIAMCFKASFGRKELTRKNGGVERNENNPI